MARLALIAALIVLPTTVIMPSATVAAETGTPAWKMPMPGTEGFLGTDGGEATKATVCDTITNYQQWIKHNELAKWRGCRPFPEGVPVVLVGVEPNALTDAEGSTALAMAKVKIPSKRFTASCRCC